MGSVLPDVIGPDLRAVFTGTAVGSASARAQAYYAGPGNSFWPTLHGIGLTPRRLRPSEYATLLEYGLGLTDVCKSASGSDREIGTAGFDVARFIALIEAHHPRRVAFNGKAAAEAVLGRKVDYGPQTERIAGAELFVLPSTSGAARGSWKVSCWQALADAVRAG